MRSFEYNRSNAVEYAKTWALSRNPRYFDFHGIGGDCTNFASQCIYAGAGVMNYTPETGWFYRSANDRTPSWTGVEFLYKFLTNNQSVGPQGRVVSESEVLPGDIVQLGNEVGDFYHTPVIIATHPTILIAAHTIDSLDRPLYTYNYSIARFIHIDKVLSY